MTWFELPADSGFGIENLPYGVYSIGGGSPRAGVRLGDAVLDLATVLDDDVFAQPTLNAFLAQGSGRWREVRAALTTVLTDETQRARVEDAAHPLTGVRLHLPIDVGDYVDFYASEHHATNIGRMFRPDTAPLTPNWKHLPIGYHGRSGTVIVSGEEIVRPNGQRPGDPPTFGPTQRLDIEAEVGFVVGVGSERGTSIDVTDFDEHVFGVCLLNDWSARDIQAWEYVPLGPFLGKSFATSISPWIVPLGALREAWVDAPARDVPVLPYLDGGRGLAIDIEVQLNGTTISRPPFAGMYWTPAQMLAHMTVNGAHVRTGDLFASGTVSGPEPQQRGCLLELTWNGAEPLALDDDSTRAFLQDGDEVVITATAPGRHGRIALGEARGRIAPAR